MRRLSVIPTTVVDAGRDGRTSRPPGAGASIRHQHSVDDLDDAVALIDVGDRDVSGAALLIRHHEVLAAALYCEGLTLHGFEDRLAAARRNLPVERTRIKEARHDMVGQDRVE